MHVCPSWLQEKPVVKTCLLMWRMVIVDLYNITVACSSICVSCLQDMSLVKKRFSVGGVFMVDIEVLLLHAVLHVCHVFRRCH